MRRSHTRLKSINTSPPIVAAYGLRKINSSYSGPALRIRRVSDNNAFDIGFLSDGTLDVFTLMNRVGSENFVLWSEDFLNYAYWNYEFASAVSSSVVPPSGSGTVYKLTENLTNNNHDVYLSYPGGVANTTQTFSCYCKAAGRTKVALYYTTASGVNGGEGIFDLTAVTATPVNKGGVTGTTASIQSIGNGWYRCSVTSAPSVSANYFPSICLLDASGNQTYLGDGSSGAYIWGAQLNSGSTLKDYCTTTGVATPDGSAFVTTLYDQSGNGRDMAQATLANQPRIVNAGVIDKLNSKPTVRTDGVSQTMATAAFALAQPFTRAGVLKMLSNPAGGTAKVYVSATADPETDDFMPSGTSNFSMYAGSVLNIKVGVVANDTATFVNVYNGATSYGSYNGTVVTGDTGTAAINGVRIGASTGPRAYGDALFGEVIVYSGPLADAARLQLEATQKSFWGL